MTRREINAVTKTLTAGLVVAFSGGVSGCVLDSGTGMVEGDLGGGGGSCRTLDFEKDARNKRIRGGDIVETAYAGAPWGVTIDVWNDEAMTKPGLGVAFDSEHPTGGDDDLAFSGLGNLLINQEHFDDDDIAAGKVEKPDDQARGAVFELTFDQAVCVSSLTLLDLDFGEDPAEIRLFDAAGAPVGTPHLVDPMGNNSLIDVQLPETDCTVRSMTVRISSSGAVDNIVVCDGPQEPVVWEDIDGEAGFEALNGVATDSDGNVIVVGEREDGQDFDGLIRKYSPTGTVLWTRVVDQSPLTDILEGVAVDADDNIVVVGYTDINGDEDVLVRKLTPAGDVIWTETFDGGGRDVGLGVAVHKDCYIALTGYVEITANNQLDAFVRVLDPAGATLWVERAGGDGNDVGFDVAVDGGGDVVVTGVLDNGTDLDIWVAKYGSDGGAPLWEQSFDNGSTDYGRGVAVDRDGNVLVTGYFFPTGSTDSDIFVRKLDPNGDPLWVQPFDGGSFDQAFDVATDAAGNVIVHGLVINETVDIWTRKYDPTGETVLWTREYDGGATDSGTGVATDVAGNVAVVGSTEVGAGNVDLFVRVYRP